MPREETHWLPRNHLEVLEGHPDRTNTSIARRYYYPFLWGFLTAVSGIFGMYATRKPVFSGVQYHIGAVSLAIAGGEIYGQLKEKYAAEEEARLKYYIQTHPENFPDYEMVKIGDILEPWIPVRS